VVSTHPAVRRGTPPGWPCGHASPAELLPGARVGEGRFVVAELLGRGGMASVYRSRDRRLGHDVALKLMLGEPAGDAARTARFEHEAELLARLPAHPGLLRLLHAGRLPELDARPFLVITLVEGPTLAFRLASDLRMPARRSVALGSSLARALVAVHGAGVIHRDLTARNVMLAGASEDAWPVVVDFGMAAELEPAPGSSRITRPDQRPGTVTAMAPEQYLGRPAHPAMDVYALGRLLHEMLTGEDPHAVVSHARLMERHRQGVRVAPRLASRGDAGPPALRELVDACLDPDPGRRPTADALVVGLKEIAGALERGATVLPFAGRCEGAARAGSGSDDDAGCGSAAHLASASVEPQVRTRADRAWQVVYVSALILGVLLGMRILRNGPGSSQELAIVPPSEPVVRVWPAEVVPLIPPSERSPPSRSLDAPSPARTGTHAPAASLAPQAARARRPAPACDRHRAHAQAAARRWDWSEVLAATADPACWPEPDARMRLRLTAWIEQRRFDACVEDGVDVRSPALVRLVERCRARLASADVGAAFGGPS
jgi:hypothetical protein